MHPPAAGVPTGRREPELPLFGTLSIQVSELAVATPFLATDSLSGVIDGEAGRQLPTSLRPYWAWVYLVFPFLLCNNQVITMASVGEWGYLNSNCGWIGSSGGTLGVEDLRGVEVKITRNKEK